MWDDDDEYFERDPITASPVWQGIAVMFGIGIALIAVLW